MIDTGLRENTYANDDPDFFCQKCWDSPHRLEMIISRTEWMTKEEELFQAWKKDSLNESN
jgi:hypothetical protein